MFLIAKDLLYGGNAVEIESAHSLPETVRRLNDLLGKDHVEAGLSGQLQGTVIAGFVELQRHQKFVRNDYKALFTGAFQQKGGRVVLVGYYGLEAGTKFFMTVWLGTAVTAFVFMLVQVWSGDASGEAPLFPLAMFALGLGIAWAGRHAARKDETWMSGLLTRALS